MKRTPWSDLHGDGVVSWTGFALLLPYSAVSMFLSNPDLGHTSVGLRLTVALAAQIFLYACLALWLTVGRRWGALTRRPLWVVTAFAVASTLRAVLVALALSALGLTSGIDWMLRLPGAVVGFTVALAILDVMIRSVRRHRARIQNLQARQHAARCAREAALTVIAEQRDTVVERIHTEFVSRINTMAESDPSLAPQQLRETVNDLVRPLSRELSARPSWRPPEAPEQTPTSFDLREFVGDVTSQPPLQPGWITILFLCFGGPFLLTQLTSGYALVLLGIGALIVWFLMWCCNVVMGFAEDRSAFTRALLMAALVGLSAMLLATSSFLVINAPQDVMRRILLGDLLLLPTIAGALVFARAAYAQERVIEARLEASAAELDWASARARGVQWLHQRGLARALHGPIQSAVGAAAIRLEHALAQGQADRQLLQTTREQLLSVIDRMESTQAHSGQLESALVEYSDTWTGVCDISWTIPADARLALERDPITRFAATELTTEACWNAIRHAHAGRVRVELEIADPGILRLTVTDDGILAETTSHRGLGTAMFDDMTVEWSRDRIAEGTKVVALIPLLEGPELDIGAAVAGPER